MATPSQEFAPRTGSSAETQAGDYPAGLHSEGSPESNPDEVAQTFPIGSWELDAKTGQLRGSDVFFRMFDLPPVSGTIPLGMVMNVLPATDRERIEKLLKKVLQTHEGFDVEHRIVRRDGATRVVRTRAQVVADVGNCLYVYGSTIDITDGRLAHDGLRQSEEKYRSLVANIPDVTWTSALDGEKPYVSPNVLHVFGFTAEEMCDKTDGFWYGRIHPSEASTIAEAFRKLFTEGQPFDVEYRAQRKDGRWIWVHDRAYRTYEKAGVRYADGIFSDITERKRAEEERERLAALVESSSDAIVGKTLEGIITAWNPGAERLFGYSAFEAVGQPMLMLIPPDRKGEEADILARLRRGERLEHFETVRVRKDGSCIDVSATISPIRDSRGMVVGASKIARDITEWKRAEEEMRKAKEAAEAANLAKSQFLANMSHEIRTPMNGVIGVAGLLLDTELTPEQRQYAEIVRSSGEALLMVINDILDFSKIEARKLSLEIRDFDLDAVVRGAVAVLSMKASEKGLKIAYRMAAGTPTMLRGDPGRLRQIVINLVGNSVKFTHQGGVTIDAGVEVLDERRVMLHFAVSDTGVGFPQERASALFEPFVQADGSSTRRYGGTGLGLTISKQLVELMGGSIGAKSEEGMGSTFWFTAVFEKQRRSSAGASASVADFRFDGEPEATPRMTAATNGMRVLLAEDNLINQQVGVAMLKKLGYLVDAVGNGAEAIDALGKTTYDLVLMDGMMPEMDGYEATRRIRDGRARIKNPQIPIVAITADAMTGDRDKCLQAGMNDYVAKPVDVRRLAEVLRKWVKASSGNESAVKELPTTVEVVFDQEEFLSRLMGDKNLAARVVAGFLGDEPRLLISLKTNLEAGDAEGAKLLAHTIKGGAATMSAGALHAVALEVQAAVAEGQLDRASILVPRMEREFALLKAALEEWGWA
jgi:PAS domain S-box-containing protein